MSVSLVTIYSRRRRTGQQTVWIGGLPESLNDRLDHLKGPRTGVIGVVDNELVAEITAAVGLVEPPLKVDVVAVAPE